MKVAAFFVPQFALLFAVNGIGCGGSLIPPSGAPASTMKTVDQVEPRIPITTLPASITTSGSYYVTGNLVGVSGNHGISITVDSVDLDLSGYCLIGVSGSFDGINVSGLAKRVTVRNGSIRGWGSDGIEAPFSSDCQFRDLKVSNNSATAIWAGSGCVIENCAAEGNCKFGSTTALATGDYSIIRNCISRGNIVTAGSGPVRGIKVGNHCLVSGNVSTGNVATGTGYVYGIQCGSYCRVENNICSENITGSGLNAFAYGIETGSSSLVVGNECTSNTCNAGSGTGGRSYGIYLNTGCVARGNLVHDNDASTFATSNGIFVAADCRVEENQVTGHNGGGQGFGIFVADGSTRSVIIRNTLSLNQTAQLRLATSSQDNYYAENMMSSSVSDAGISNLAGTGDRANIEGY